MKGGAHKWATKAQKARKRRKYLANAKARGDIFRPLVFETHGKMSEEVADTLDMLAAGTTMDRGIAVTNETRVAVTLAGATHWQRGTQLRARRGRGSGAAQFILYHHSSDRLMIAAAATSTTTIPVATTA
jgi:hypothetical protein